MTASDVTGQGFVRNGVYDTFATGTGDVAGATPLWVAAYAANPGPGSASFRGRSPPAELERRDPAKPARGGRPSRPYAKGRHDTVDGRRRLRAGGAPDHVPRAPRLPTAAAAGEILIEAGVDVNATNEGDLPALHCTARPLAALNERVRQLVQHGAELLRRAGAARPEQEVDPDPQLRSPLQLGQQLVLVRPPPGCRMLVKPAAWRRACSASRSAIRVSTSRGGSGSSDTRFLAASIRQDRDAGGNRRRAGRAAVETRRRPVGEDAVPWLMRRRNMTQRQRRAVTPPRNSSLRVPRGIRRAQRRPQAIQASPSSTPISDPLNRQGFLTSTGKSN